MPRLSGLYLLWLSHESKEKNFGTILSIVVIKFSYPIKNQENMIFIKKETEYEIAYE